MGCCCGDSSTLVLATGLLFLLSQVEAANIAKQQVRGSCGLLLATGFETYCCCSQVEAAKKVRVAAVGTRVPLC